MNYHTLRLLSPQRQEQINWKDQSSESIEHLCTLLLEAWLHKGRVLWEGESKGPITFFCCSPNAVAPHMGRGCLCLAPWVRGGDNTPSGCPAAPSAAGRGQGIGCRSHGRPRLLQFCGPDPGYALAGKCLGLTADRCLPWAETGVKLYQQPQRAFHLFNLHLVLFCFVVLFFLKMMQPGIPKEPRENKHKQVYNYGAHLCGATAPSLLPCLLVAGGDRLEEEGWLFGDKLWVSGRVSRCWRG